MVILGSGVTPKQFMLEVMAGKHIPDSMEPNERFTVKLDAAKAAAPYVHPRLQATQIQEIPAPITPGTLANNLDIARRIAYALRQGQLAKKAQEPS